jgi:hypothetical protein
MLPLYYTSDPWRTITLLNPEEIQDPLPVVQELCHEMDIGECRWMLRQLVHTALIEDSGYNDVGLRGSLIERYNILEKGLEGVFVLMDFIKARPKLAKMLKDELAAGRVKH